MNTGKVFNGFHLSVTTLERRYQREVIHRKGEHAMKNTSKFLAIGLVLGAGIGIVVGSLMDNVTMGIVFGGGFGLIMGLAIGAGMDRRAES
jgi:F0F1-type ATP synthase assembly protein I